MQYDCVNTMVHLQRQPSMVRSRIVIVVFPKITSSGSTGRRKKMVMLVKLDEALRRDFADKHAVYSSFTKNRNGLELCKEKESVF